LELEDEHARIARHNIANAGYESIAETKVGPPLSTRETVNKEGGVKPFDMVFIDRDKDHNVGYLKWALKSSHVGTLIIMDIVVRRGRSVNMENLYLAIVRVRAVFESVQKEKRLECAALQTGKE
jgi:predicted O-methyltransferase YrrM